MSSGADNRQSTSSELHTHRLPRNAELEEVFAKVWEELVKIACDHLPILQDVTMQIVDTVFVPKVIAKQLMLLVALETGMMTARQITSIIQSVLTNFSSRSRLIRQLESEQQQASVQDEWMDLAERIDSIQGNDVWRSDPSCPLYEQERISARIDELVHLMRRRDIFELMFVLRASIGRNKFGLLHEGLFSKALAGTKVLVETYHNVVCAALDFCCDAPVSPDEDPIPTDARLAFFNETRHAYGRTALLLSGGAALGFYHTGVVKTLMENRLMPRVIGGSSAGSLVCAMIATRTDEECVHDMFNAQGTDAPGHSGQLPLNFFRPLQTGNINAAKVDATPNKQLGGIREVYYNTAGFFHDAKRTLQGLVPIPLRHFSAVLYDIVTGNRRPQDMLMNDTEHFRACVRACVGNFTFQEAFDRTGRILNIVVTPKNNSDPPRLLNYLTAPHVMVWSAAVASSSLPGVFEANRLVVKEADGWERYESGGAPQHFSDGSMEQDLPMQQLSEMFNVNHFLISQANPHAVMFANYQQKNSVWSNPVTGFVDSILTFLRDQVRTWLLHLVACVGARSITPMFQTQRGIGTTFLTQEYEGRSCDISLIPWLGHRGLFSALLHIIYNPREAEFREWIQAAERETWRHIPAIKSHIAEEVTLDRCVQRLRKRLVQESWEKHTSGVEQETMGGRVPSFFTSTSLVNLSGLNVSDQPAVEGLHGYNRNSGSDVRKVVASPMNIVPDINIHSGWGGQGLRGNRSSGNLQRSISDGSGLFIDDEEPTSQQQAGEETEMPLRGHLARNSHRTKSENSSLQTPGYVKSTSMAKFYYRKTGDYNVPELRKTTSDPLIEREGESDSSSTDGTAPRLSHQRRKSKSHTELNWTSSPLN